MGKIRTSITTVKYRWKVEKLCQLLHSLQPLLLLLLLEDLEGVLLFADRVSVFTRGAAVLLQGALLR